MTTPQQSPRYISLFEQLDRERQEQEAVADALSTFSHSDDEFPNEDNSNNSFVNTIVEEYNLCRHDAMQLQNIAQLPIEQQILWCIGLSLDIRRMCTAVSVQCEDNWALPPDAYQTMKKAIESYLYDPTCPLYMVEHRKGGVSAVSTLLREWVATGHIHRVSQRDIDTPSRWAKICQKAGVEFTRMRSKLKIAVG